jgi:hypothetical protein
MKEKSRKKEQLHEAKSGFMKFLIAKGQYADWLLLALACVAGYFAVKSGYPYPLATSDSGGYVLAAQTDTFFFYRPFGYSVLLQIIHAISHSIHAVFVGQMLLYFMAVSGFAFTIKYFFTPANKILWYLLLFLFAFSPMAFILANCLLSDLLFGAIIYILLASFVFSVKRKNWIALVVFLFALYCSLHVRYSAMVFPVIFIACFLCLKGKIRIASIVGILIVTFVFHKQVKNMMNETTKINQFSTGFDGWQFANNAMHVIPYVDLDTAKITDKKVREFHQFMASHKEYILEKTQQGTRVTAGFLWDVKSPLKQFLQKEMVRLQRPYAHLWIKLGSTTYKEYGQFLMLKYPWTFMRYYYLPNLKNVFFLDAPGVIFRETSIGQGEYKWYELDESQDLSCKNPFYKGFTWKFMQVSWALGWVCVLILSVWSVLWRKRIKYGGTDKIVFLSIFAFGAIYYASTVFASPIEDRYWFPMECVHFSFCYILLNKLILCMKPVPVENNHIQPAPSVEPAPSVKKPVVSKGKGKRRSA